MPTPAYTDYKNYLIMFRNRDEYDFAVAAAGGDATTGGVFYGLSPNSAAAMFGIPIPYPTGNLDLLDKTITQADTLGLTDVTIPYVGSPPNPPVTISPSDDDGILVPPVSLGPPLGNVGSYFTLKWAGLCVFMGGQQPSTDTPTAIPQRRWIGGMELESNMEGGAFSTGVGCRDSSRTLDGIGFAARGQNTPGTTWTRALNEYGAFTTRKSFERVYFRGRVVGTGNVGFWRCHNSVSPAAGAALVYNTSGGIDLYTVSNVGALTLVASGYVPTTEWTRCDIILQYPASGAEDGRLIVLFNGVPTYDVTDSSGGSMDSIGFHANSEIGKGVSIGALGTADAQVEFDLDDWVNAEWPTQAGVLFLDSMDLLMGSHIRRAFNISGTVANYTPVNAFNVSNQGHNPAQQLSSGLNSTTSGALIDLTTDIPTLGTQDKATGLSFGVVAGIIGIHSSNSLNTDGQLGYDAAGAGPVMATINETSVAAFNSVRYQPSGLITPVEVSPFKVRYTKSADAANVTVNGVQGILEEIGIWGEEDCPDPTLFPSDVPRRNNLHNCMYPQTPYAILGPTPLANVTVVGGTYTGNGTQQDISLPDACHMLFIRPTTVGVSGVKWFACGIGGHLGTTDRVVPNMPVRVWFDDVAGTFKFTVTGTSAEVNQNALTYQYIAFCDPGMRFCCGGAYNTPSVVTSRDNTLQNSDFLPEFAFVQSEVLGNTSNAQGLRVKGPGNTGVVGNTLSSAGVVTDFGSFANGVLTTRADLHPSTQSQSNYLAFRSTEPGCGWVMMQIMSYTGNGTSPRTINLTPSTGGRFPLFVLVCPTSGAQSAIFRDPSHAGSNSATFTGLANTATGITGGAADQITVQSSLNANGVVYNVFCIPGDTAGWNNGTFFPPNCDQPEPWFNPPMVPPEIAVFGEGGLVLNGDAPLTLLKDVSGIYTLVPGKTSDTLIDRQTGATSAELKIPDPFAKTGFIGG